MKAGIYLLISLIFFLSCQQSEEKRADDLSFFSKSEEHPGRQLMEANCYVCHSPTANHDNRIAPPMFAVKNHYTRKSDSKEEFILNIQNWISDPSKDNARMHGAVEKFGVMPKQDFSEETIRLIADYLYDNDIEKPNCSGNGKSHSKQGKRNQDL